jgi:hypothetical protein
MIRIINTSASALSNTGLTITGSGASVFTSAVVSGTNMNNITLTLAPPYTWYISDDNNTPIMYSGQILKFTSYSSPVPSIAVFQLPTDAAGTNTFTYKSADGRDAILVYTSGGMINTTRPSLPTNNLFYVSSTSVYGLILRFLIYN